MIRFETVSRAYGALTAVNNVSLHVHKGEVFGLLGSNGAGKTTLNKMLVGLLRPDAGRVLIDGVSMTEAPAEAKRKFGYLPEVQFLYPELTLLEFMQFVGGIKGLSRGEIEKDCETMLDIFSLREAARQTLSTYSQGMGKKAALMAAILGRPPLVILDEPTNGMDPPSVVLIKNVIHKLKEKGSCVFVSSHNLPFIEQCVDRIGIMEKGALVAVGTRAELQAEAARARPHLASADLEALFLHFTGRQVNSADRLFEE